MEGQFIGRYELRGEIGRGAMARVWRAWDPNLERQVAIKEPLISDTLSDEVQQEIGRRFVKEAKAAAMLNHPNIVAVYEADIFDGRPAIVMELVEGATLGQVLDASGKLSPEAAGPILDDLLDGIGYAHSKGIVHRDLKPDNIFVTSEGRVKIGDFGIAHLQGASQTQATQMGTVLGTPGYMSPEQARGAAVDSRSDLFSVGVIAYEMLAGYNPFRLGDTDSTTVLYRIVHEDVPGLNAVGLAGLPESMAAAVSLALSKDPASRPATAEIMKTILHGGTASSKAFSDRTVISKQVKRTAISGWAPYVAVVAVCAVVLGGIFMAAGSSSGGGGGGSYAGTAANQTATQTAAKANVNSSGANVNTNTNANANANTNVSTSANTKTSTNT
ncbi:MAG: serine/threonine-protein kinase, partial [Coriobacteriia bacterium]|nr:serine/threonine-protein kinase [Coriobacteriia bacterium]